MNKEGMERADSIYESIKQFEKYINEKTPFSMSSRFENGVYIVRLDGMEEFLPLYTMEDSSSHS